MVVVVVVVVGTDVIFIRLQAVVPSTQSRAVTTNMWMWLRGWTQPPDSHTSILPCVHTGTDQACFFHHFLFAGESGRITGELVSLPEGSDDGGVQGSGEG